MHSEETGVSLINDFGKTVCPFAKGWNWTPYFMPYQKNQLKTDWKLKHKTWNCKTSRKFRGKLYDVSYHDDFIDVTAKAQQKQT